MERTLSYVEAIREALDSEMQSDPSVVVFGIDVDDPKAILGTVQGLQEKYGEARVFGTPLSEDAMTGAAVGMALAGLRPVHVHIRMDFLMLAMNQLINMAAKMHYMYAGQQRAPMVVRSIIGKSWGQGAQHSQGLYPMFMNVPGIKVVAPSTAYDAKGCLIAAIRDDNPVLFIEHRILYYHKSPVPQASYVVAPGKARIAVAGRDITLVGISYMQTECLRAQRYLAEIGIHAEVIDPIWLSPLDTATIIASVNRTGRLLVVDNSWVTCGAGAEILAAVGESVNGDSHIRMRRLGFAPVPCPTTPVLEEHFYPNARTIAAEACDLVRDKPCNWVPVAIEETREFEFKGPF